MLPSLSRLCRERTLLWEVLRAAEKEAGSEERCCKPEGLDQDSSLPGVSKEAAKNIASIVADKLQGRDGLQDLPPELLVDIAEQFLESPVWHLCQLGETSEHLGKVFNDEALWQGFLETRFREASRSPRRRAQRSPSPTSARRTYAQLHTLERRFSEGLFSTRSTLDNPRQGVAVLDLRIAPGPVSASAFAALGDGSVMVYDLDPPSNSFLEDEKAIVETQHDIVPPTPLRELSPAEGGGPALCCLPIESNAAVQSSAFQAEGQAAPLMLAAGYALGRLKAWNVSVGRPIVVEAWEQAHAGRISALASLGGDSGALLSAAGDGLVKAWDLGGDRFGDHRQSFSGHRDSVVSVAASPFDRHTLLTGSHDRSLRLWDARMGGRDSAEVASWRQQDWVTCVDFHPTSEYLILSSDKCVHTWDIRKSGLPVASSHRHRKLVSRFRVDPLRLVSCSLDGCVKVSSLEDPCVRRASPHASPSSSPVLRPTSPPVALGNLGQAEIGSETCTLRTSTDYVLCIDFDSTRLLTGGVNGQMNAYDFSDPGNFRLGSPAVSPLRSRCGQPVEFHISGMQEIEV